MLKYVLKGSVETKSKFCLSVNILSLWFDIHVFAN